jgi:hypothetical protein
MLYLYIRYILYVFIYKIHIICIYIWYILYVFIYKIHIIFMMYESKMLCHMFMYGVHLSSQTAISRHSYDFYNKVFIMMYLWWYLWILNMKFSDNVLNNIACIIVHYSLVYILYINNTIPSDTTCVFYYFSNATCFDQADRCQVFVYTET